jgi:hypothetical protein
MPELASSPNPSAIVPVGGIDSRCELRTPCMRIWS